MTTCYYYSEVKIKKSQLFTAVILYIMAPRGGLEPPTQ